MKFGYDTIRYTDTITGKVNKELKTRVPWYPAGKQLGIMAGQLQPVFSELVRYDSATHLHAVNYQGFIPILIQALKATNARVTELENELKNIKTKESLKSANNTGLTDDNGEAGQNRDVVLCPSQYNH